MPKHRKSEKLKEYLSLKVAYGKYNIAKKSVRKKVVITDWNSEEGLNLFRESDHKVSFFNLAHNYVAQINPFFCGVATVTTVLNTFRAKKGFIPNQEDICITKPDGTIVEYRYYTQLNILDKETEKIKPIEKIAPCFSKEEITEENFNPGISIYNVIDILEYHFVEVEAHICDKDIDDNLDKFRADLKRVLSGNSELIIANFDGTTCGLKTGGHFSTIGAYNEKQDEVLILDSAGFKNPWFWVPTKHIYHAMNTESEDGYRGYLIVKDEFDEFLEV